MMPSALKNYTTFFTLYELQVELRIGNGKPELCRALLQSDNNRWTVNRFSSDHGGGSATLPHLQRELSHHWREDLEEHAGETLLRRFFSIFRSPSLFGIMPHLSHQNNLANLLRRRSCIRAHKAPNRCYCITRCITYTFHTISRIKFQWLIKISH